jgi:hypothetical protein
VFDARANRHHLSTWQGFLQASLHQQPALITPPQHNHNVVVACHIHTPSFLSQVFNETIDSLQAWDYQKTAFHFERLFFILFN